MSVDDPESSEVLDYDEGAVRLDDPESSEGLDYDEGPVRLDDPESSEVWTMMRVL